MIVSYKNKSFFDISPIEIWKRLGLVHNDKEYHKLYKKILQYSKDWFCEEEGSDFFVTCRDLGNCQITYEAIKEYYNCSIPLLKPSDPVNVNLKKVYNSDYTKFGHFEAKSKDLGTIRFVAPFSYDYYIEGLLKSKEISYIFSSIGSNIKVIKNSNSFKEVIKESNSKNELGLKPFCLYKCNAKITSLDEYKVLNKDLLKIGVAPKKKNEILPLNIIVDKVNNENLKVGDLISCDVWLIGYV